VPRRALLTVYSVLSIQFQYSVERNAACLSFRQMERGGLLRYVRALLRQMAAQNDGTRSAGTYTEFRMKTRIFTGNRWRTLPIFRIET